MRGKRLRHILSLSSIHNIFEGVLEFPISGNWGLGCRISGAKWVDEGGTHWPLKRQEGTTSTLLNADRSHQTECLKCKIDWLAGSDFDIKDRKCIRYIFSDYFEFCFLTGPTWCSRTREGPVASNLPRLEQQVGVRYQGGWGNYSPKRKYFETVKEYCSRWLLVLSFVGRS